jgi:hypothetical protein
MAPCEQNLLRRKNLWLADQGVRTAALAIRTPSPAFSAVKELRGELGQPPKFGVS